MHNGLKLEDLYGFYQEHGIGLYLLGDMKMGNHVLNLGTHSNFYPLLWNLWSHYVPKGSPMCPESTIRTIASCIEQVKLREADRESKSEKSDKEYYNVKGMPINLLVHIS